MFANYDIRAILLLARKYSDHRGISLSTCSLRAARSGSLFGKLEKRSAGLTLGRRDRIAQWFSNNWPDHDGLAWPSDIPRPKKSRKPKDAA